MENEVIQSAKSITELKPDVPSYESCPNIYDRHSFNWEAFVEEMREFNLDYDGYLVLKKDPLQGKAPCNKVLTFLQNRKIPYPQKDQWNGIYIDYSKSLLVFLNNVGEEKEVSK